MTREEVKTIFPDVTDEQITSLLNTYNKDIATVKATAKKYESDAQKAADLQKKLDEINEQNMTELEKANKSAEDANKRVAELEQSIKTLQLKNNLAENGIVGENADKLLESVTSGNFDASILKNIIETSVKSATAELEKKFLDETKNTNGASMGAKGGDDTPDDVKNANALALGVVDFKTAKSTQDFYK